MSVYSISRLRQSLVRYKNEIIFLIIAILFFLFFSYQSLKHFYSLNVNGLDLGVYTQSVYSVLKGRILVNTLLPENMEPTSHLAHHFDPILFFFVPFIAIFPSALTLLLLQNLLISVGSYFLYRIALLKTHSFIFALACVILYFLSPFNNAFSDFRPSRLMTIFLLSAIYFKMKKQSLFFWISVLLVLFTKETASFSIMVLGLVFITMRKCLRDGVLLIIIGLIWLIVTMGVFIPYFGGHSYLFLENLYSLRGTMLSGDQSFLESLKNCLSKVSHEDMLFLRMLFLSVLFLIFLSLRWLLALIPFVIAIGLVNIPHYSHYNMLNWYVMQYWAFLLVGLIYGTRNLKYFLRVKKIKFANKNRFYILISILLVIVSLVQHNRCSFQSPFFIHYDKEPLRRRTFKKKLFTMFDQIPNDAIVATENNIAPFLSTREFIYVLPLVKKNPDYVLLCLKIPPCFISDNQYEKFRNYLLNGENYELVSSTKQNFLFKRKGHTIPYTPFISADLKVENIEWSDGIRPKANITLNIKNNGFVSIDKFGADMVNVGIVIARTEEHILIRDFERINLPQDINPGESISLKFSVEVPLENANLLKIDLVNEGHFWFEWIGGKPLYIKIPK